MLKIMIVGGVPVSLIKFRGDLIKQWLSMGYEVVAVSAPADEALSKEIAGLGVTFKPIPVKRDSLNIFEDIKAMFKLYKIIKLEKPDYIFAYTVKPVIFSALCSSLINHSKLYLMITGLGYAFSGGSLKQSVLKKILIVLYRYAVKQSEAVFFQNKDDPDLFKSLNILTAKNNVVMVYGSGVNVDYYYYSEAVSGNNTTFLLICRLLKSKGVMEYLEAAEIIGTKYPSAVFNLVGPLHESPDKIDSRELEKYAARENINYLGRLKDVRPYIERCSVYVLPSYYGEGTPRSILEAMAMGRPIIATDAPGCRETVEVGVNGFLIPARNSEALAEAMEEFILNPGLIEAMGKESRRIAEEKYDVRKVNKAIIEAMGLDRDKNK